MRPNLPQFIGKDFQETRFQYMDLMTLVGSDGEDRKKKIEVREGCGTAAGYERE